MMCIRKCKSKLCEILLLTARMPIIYKMENNKIGEDAEKLEPSYVAGRNGI